MVKESGPPNVMVLIQIAYNFFFCLLDLVDKNRIVLNPCKDYRSSANGSFIKVTLVITLFS